MKKNIELEKKFIFKEGVTDQTEKLKNIKEIYNLTDPSFVINDDIYYDEDDILEAYGISVRKRDSQGKVEYTVKRRINDENISKRDEINFDSFDEIINFLKHEWNIPIEKLNPKVKLRTLRQKFSYNLNDNLYEIVFDQTFKFENGQNQEYFMIECELKNGQTESLEQIGKMFLQIPYLEECFKSKKEIVLSGVQYEKVENPFTKPVDLETYYNKEIVSYFQNCTSLLDRLKELQERKEEISDLRKKYGPLAKPIVLTTSGTPRAGKTTCIDNLFEFLKKSGLTTKCLEEPAGLVYATLKSKEEKAKLLEDRVGFVEKQYEIGQEYISKNLENNDILLCDRGVLDTFIWYDFYYRLGMVDKDNYQKYLTRLKDSVDYYNLFYGLYVNSRVSMLRDYQNSLSIEPRSTMNEANVKRYNSSLLRMIPMLEGTTDNVMLINTSNLEKMDASVIVANDVLDKVKNLYLGRR